MSKSIQDVKPGDKVCGICEMFQPHPKTGKMYCIRGKHVVDKSKDVNYWLPIAKEPHHRCSNGHFVRKEAEKEQEVNNENQSEERHKV